ncbi:MAG: hypothetical protein KKA42_00595 [candidate division Zixibacteria bacterium]|nr:hypothetical protein [candidate division Zixibacteria bacterium]
MEGALITGIVFLSIVAIVKMIGDNRTKRQLIEKGAVDEQVKRMLLGHSELSTLSNLKWGMVLVGIGLAAILSRWLPYYWSDEGALGLVFLFAGLGFLIYYPIAQKRLREIERRQQNTASGQ